MAKKILFIVIAFIAIIIIVLAVFTKIYVTPERVKAFIIPEAEKALNRKVTIGEINISLLKGIEVTDFAIKEADGKTDFAACKDFILKYKFLQLLSRKLVIDELKVLSPEIRIVRNEKGKFNFEGIGHKQKPVKGKEGKKAVEQRGLPVSLLVSRVEIRDLRFTFIDQKKELPYIKGSADISTSIKSSGKSEISTEGDIDLKLDEVVIKKPSVKQIKNLSASLRYAVSVNLESNTIRINAADLKIQEIPASITGEIENFNALPVINIAVSIPKTGLKNIQKTLDSFVTMKGLSLSGDVTADLTITGMPEKMESLKTNGTLTLRTVGIDYNNVYAILDGRLKFSEQSMTVDLKSTVGKNTAELKGSVSSYFKNQKINLNFYSKQLFLDEIIPIGTAPAQEGKPAPGKPSAEAKPLDLKLTADGEIKIDSARYKGMTMTNFYARYQLKNNTFEITKMTANAGKGKFNLNSIVDLSKPGYMYRLSGNLDSLHAHEVVNSFFPKAKDTVFGILSLNVKLNGAGTLPENMKKNLVANGDFIIRDGKITNNKISENLARFLGIPELRTILLKEANGTVKIRNGVARLDTLFSSDDVSMNPTGNIGLLHETLDLAFDLKLSPALTEKVTFKAKQAEYIKDETGWGIIPLKISGTFSSPSYSVDIAKVGKRVIEKKAKRLIDDLLNKGRQPDEGTPQEKKRPIEDLLKGLFR